MVISKYLFDLGNETSAMCVDANKEWLNLTRSKIKRVSSLDPDRVDWVEWSESEYVKIKNFVSSANKLFVFLDAQLTDKDDLHGMRSLARILEDYSASVVVLIDCRSKAVWSIKELASALKSNLSIASNCLFAPKSLNYEQPMLDFLGMGSFTYVAKQGNA